MQADRVWGTAILLFGGIYLLEGIRIPPAAIGDPLGPRVFPTVLGGVMLVCGGALLLRPAAPHGAATLTRRFFGPVLLLCGLLVAYALSLSWIGYPVATCVFMVIAAGMMGERSLIRSLAIALTFSVGMYVLFTRFLLIPLPPGVLRLLGLE